MRPLLTILVLISLSGQAQTVEETPISLKSYVDMLAQRNLEYMKAEFENIRENVRIANMAMDKRMDGVNEFRAQLKDQVATFPTRKELWGYIVAIAGLVFGYANFKKNQEAKSGGSVIRSGDNVEVKK